MASRIVSTPKSLFDPDYVRAWSTSIESNDSPLEVLWKLCILSVDLFWNTLEIIFFDEHYMWWFLGMLLTGVACFFYPLIYLIFVIFYSLFMRFTRRKVADPVPDEFWKFSRWLLSKIFEIHGKICHGHETIGLENIPRNGPAIIIFYHSQLPIDCFYTMSASYLYRNRVVRIVADNICRRLPGWKQICEVWTVCPNTVEGCLESLKRGDLILISPGGMKEMLLSDSDKYNVMWNDRLGFTRLIHLAKAPIIPMFTENGREFYRTPFWAKRIVKWLYERTKGLYPIMYGEFPVKSRTHIGAPIPYNPYLDAEETRDVIKEALENLIKENQRLPGSVFRALRERIYSKRKLA